MIRQILDNQIDCLDTDFKYWVTIDWFNKQTNEAAVHSRHKELRRSIRAFYGEPIKTWWFNEVHKDPFSPHYGGYHSHAVVSDCSPERWKNPSRRMERFLSERIQRRCSRRSQVPIKRRTEVCALGACAPLIAQDA